jgi:hypothetical protein
MSENRKYNRREFIQTLGALSVVGVGAGTVLAGCGNGEQTADTAADPCADVSGLTEAEIQTRRNFNYVGQTPYPDQRCDNCQLWVEPAPGQTCGGCRIMEGPINPAGWCTAWVPVA